MTSPAEQAPATTSGAGGRSAAADRHAVLVTGAAVYTPSGIRLAGAVDSVDKLATLLTWLADKSRTPTAATGLAPAGVVAQVWLIGATLIERLGWYVDPGDREDGTMAELRAAVNSGLSEKIAPALPILERHGWTLRGAQQRGHLIQLTRTATGDRAISVDLVVEPYAWTMNVGGAEGAEHLGVLGAGDADTGTGLPEDDLPAAAELGRRLAWSVQHLGTLPGPTAAATGANVYDKIRRDRLRRNSKLGSGSKAKPAIVVSEPGPIPPLTDPPRGLIEPPVNWARVADVDDLEHATELLTVDQRASYLASAGVVDLGYGDPTQHDAHDAEAAARADKTPFGLWRVTIPALDTLNLPEQLPAPHPDLQPTATHAGDTNRGDRPATLWVTSESLRGFTAPVVDGGLGLDLDDLVVEEAWVWPHQARVLEPWTKTLRAARGVAADSADAAMGGFVRGIYHGYIGRMQNADSWSGKWVAHHHQPVWRAAIIANARWRGRRKATTIGVEQGIWPLMSATDSWTYAVGEGHVIADDSPNLGQLVIEQDKRAPLTDELILALLEAETPAQTAKVINDAFAPARDLVEE